MLHPYAFSTSMLQSLFFKMLLSFFAKLLSIRKMYQPKIMNKNEIWVYIYRNEADVKNS